MKVKIKKLDPNAVIPTKAHASDAGLDLTAVSKKVSSDTDFIEYGTGLAIEIPEGHAGFLFPRSSISKKDLSLANSVGVVDVGFLGEVRFRFKRTLANVYYEGWTAGTDSYDIGDRIGQLIILPIPSIEFEEVEELEETERGDGGFGSSGS